MVHVLIGRSVKKSTWEAMMKYFPNATWDFREDQFVCVCGVCVCVRVCVMG